LQNREALVLIVDDNATNIDLLVNTLKEDYRLGIAKNGPKALEYAARHHPDLILLDIMMPEMNGYEVCTRLKGDPATMEIPVIFITALDEPGRKTHGFEVGGVDYVTKPFHAAEVKARVRTHLTLQQMRKDLSNQNIVLEKKVNEKTAELQAMLNATVKSIAFALEMRDPYTAGHQQRVEVGLRQAEHRPAAGHPALDEVDEAGAGGAGDRSARVSRSRCRPLPRGARRVRAPGGVEAGRTL